MYMYIYKAGRPWLIEMHESYYNNIINGGRYLLLQNTSENVENASSKSKDAHRLQQSQSPTRTSQHAHSSKDIIHN